MNKKILLENISRLHICVGLFATLTLSAPTLASTSTPETYTAPSSIEKVAASNFSASTISGETITLSDYKGKVIFINFWATWCGPCRKEIPDFITLKKTYSDSLEIIGISADDTKEPVVSFVNEHGVNYPVIMNSPEIQAQFGQIRGIPTTFIIDKNMTIVQKIVGLRSYDEFKSIIDQLQ